MVTALTINYNTPDYLERLLISFRKFYPDLPYVVIDGSSKAQYQKIKNFPKLFNVNLIHFDYNIHHGPGMVYGIKQVIKTNQVLLVDSDMIIHDGGWLEMMTSELRRDSYGIGDIQKEYYLEAQTTRVPMTINAIRAQRKVMNGRPIPKVNTAVVKVWVDYLHPAFALINKDVMLRYPLPIKGGAPLIEAMTKIWQEHNTHILQRAQWLTDDLWNHKKQFVQHNDTHKGMGTVDCTGGYHLD